MADNFSCTNCKKKTEVILDHAIGDALCGECGLILESYSIDESFEWRTFTDDKNNNSDPNRVGGPNNPFLIDASDEGDGSSNNNGNCLSKVSTSLNKKFNRLTTAFKTIEVMADRLSLVSTIRDRAKEIYKDLFECNSYQILRGKNVDAMFAACIYVACQENNLPRTLKEVCSIVSSRTLKKEIGRAKAFIMQHLKKNNEDVAIDSSNNKKVVIATDFVRRFCSNLGTMDQRSVRAAVEAVQTCEKAIDVRRSPLSLAAAVIFIICQLIEESKRPTLRDIALATSVAKPTIKSASKDLMPHLPKIVPRWFASEAALKNLCNI